MNKKQLDEGKRYLKKAAEDHVLLQKHLDDEEIADSIFGFHAQQSVEKLLKAILMIKGAPFKKTHDLTLLYELCEQNNIAMPCGLDELDSLTPYAVIFRYDEIEDEELDRHQALNVVEKVKKWAHSFFSSHEKDA